MTILQKLFFLLISTLFTTSLLAEALYVKVASLTRSDALFSMQYELNDLGYKSYIAEHNEYYRVYAGPFKSRYDANMALKDIQENISPDAYLTKVTVKNNKLYVTKVEEQKREEVVQAQTQEVVQKSVPLVTVTTTSGQVQSVQVGQQKMQNQTTTETTQQMQAKSASASLSSTHDSKKPLFVGLSFGASKFDIGTKGDLPLDISMRSYGPNYGLEFGYYVSNTLFTTLNYQRSDLRNASFDSAYVTLNYQLERIGTARPYLGICVGASKLNWRANPVNGADATENLYSVIGGVQVGTDVALYGGFELYGYYRYMMMDFNTLVASGGQSSEIEHSSQQDFNVGMKYRF